jgi:hypothetical protein
VKGLLWACALATCGPAPAAAVEWQLEPAHVTLERLDAIYDTRVGLSTRLGVRIAYGLGARWGAWSVGVQQGHATGHVDFGLLDHPGSRLHRMDTSAELRWRLPVDIAGWRVQPAVGVGRIDLRYRPDAVHFVAGGQIVQVTLQPESRWTRHVAAEVLHDVAGHTQLILRAAWRFYRLDLATPEGNETRSVADVQCGVAFRVHAF